MNEKNKRDDGIIYQTKSPKMNVMADWQIKLQQIANTDRESFSSTQEYIDYIEETTKGKIQEQDDKLKKAWADLEKSN